MKLECKILKPLGIVERESTAVYPVDPPFLAKALLLLDENMERPVSATALAKAVGVSSSTLRAREGAHAPHTSPKRIDMSVWSHAPWCITQNLGPYYECVILTQL